MSNIDLTKFDNIENIILSSLIGGIVFLVLLIILVILFRILLWAMFGRWN